MSGTKTPTQPRTNLADPALRARAQEARRVKAKARAESPLRRDFMPDDQREWERLASLYGVRLPPWGEPPTRATMSRFLHKLGLTWQDHAEWSGWAKPESWITHNADWPLRAWAGLMLELRARLDALKETADDDAKQMPLLTPSPTTPDPTPPRRRVAAA